MKEERFFYDPRMNGELPQEEVHHAVKVLRLAVGDEMWLMDGCGTYYRTIITAATGHRCLYLNDRVEWFAEKATEIGFDELTFLDCQFSERRVIKEERIDKILVSAMKQSHKAWKPVLDGMTSFERFVQQERKGDKFICHCYPKEDIGEGGDKPFLMDVLQRGVESTVMIGPEGDFSVDEVKFAIQHGYHSVSLGTSRLRTETAALVAVHMMQLINQIQ